MTALQHHPRRSVRLDTLVRLRWLAIFGQIAALLVVITAGAAGAQQPAPPPPPAPQGWPELSGTWKGKNKDGIAQIAAQILKPRLQKTIMLHNPQQVAPPPPQRPGT